VTWKGKVRKKERGEEDIRKGNLPAVETGRHREIHGDEVGADEM
jgi:hypothetical protein